MARAKKAPARPATTETPDDYKEKLVKYVPAEVLAFFVPISAVVGAGEETLLVLVFLAGAIGTLGYLYKANLKVKEEQRAPWWNYVLAVSAFVAWGLATSPATASVVDLSQKEVGIILAIAAFLIPALDFWGSGQQVPAKG